MPSISKFYLHDAATADTGTLPAVTSSISTRGNAETTPNKSMDDVAGSAQTSATISTSASTIQQFHKLARFLSAPLTAQTISAQNWTFRIAAAESNANSNMFLGLSIAVWRPSTGALVGRIFDGPGAGTSLGTEPGTTETAEAVMTVSGSAVTAQTGDILVVEIWTVSTQAMATSYTQTVYYDGATEGSATDQAAYVAPTTAVSMFVPPTITPTTGISATSTVSGSVSPGRPIAPDTGISATSTVSGAVTDVAGSGDTPPSLGVIDAFAYGGTVGGLAGVTGNWAIPGGTATGLRYADHGAGTVNPTAALCGCYYTAATYGPDCECIADMTAVDTVGTTNVIRVVARMQNPTSATIQSRYQVAASANGTWLIQKVINNATSTLATLSQAIATGDKIAIQCVGSSIKAWWYDGAGAAWHLVGKVTDTDISAAGNMGLYLQGSGTSTAWTADNFAGGTLTVGTKSITPAAINATSTVSGSLVRAKLLAPAVISATASVSGGVRVTHRIGGAISATSVVSGSFIAARPVVPAAISATSTVTGRVGAPRRLTGAISATSIVSGLVGAIRRIAGVISATAVVSGAVRATHRIAGAISATSVVSGVVQRLKPITPANIAATSAVTGGVVKLARIVGVINAISTVSGRVTALRRVAGAITATSVVSGTVSRLRPIVPGAISATSTVSGVVGRVRQLVPAGISATSIVSGSLRVTRRISGAIAATSTVSGSIRIGGKISGAIISATSTVSGSVVRIRHLAGVILATSTVSGAIGRVRHLIGVITAASAVSGRVAVIRPLAVSAISATSVVTGRVTVLRYVTGAINATSAISGAIQRIIHPVGVINATSTVGGEIALVIPISGAISAISVVSGSFISQPPSSVGGNIFATSTMGAAIRLGYHIYGKETPRITSADLGESQLTSTGYEKPVLERAV